MIDRSRRTGPDPLLEWKLGLFFVGAVLLVVAMATKRNVLALGAALVLGVATVIGLVDRYRRRRAEEAQRWESEEDDALPQ